MSIPTFTLNNGVDIPALGLGVYQTPPDETTAAVEAALEIGYRHVDTAAAYGNERQVGEAIRRSGLARDDVFIETKVWITDFGYDATLHAFDKAAGKLGVDRIDLFILHQALPSEFDLTLDAYRALEQLYADGKVRAIGVSNFEVRHLEELMQRTTVVPAVNQIEYHPYFAQTEVEQFCREHGILVQSWSPIGGITSYRGSEGQETTTFDDPTIAQIAQAHQATPAQVMLRWQLQRGRQVIPKSVNPERIRESLDQGNIAIVAGFQGVHRATKDITTLGRGGSDTTAVALAAALDADVCEIYSDVDGVFTADPRIAPKAHKLEEISSEEMLEMAANGAKILHLRCVEYARRFGVKLHVRSSFTHHEGTWVIPSPDDTTVSVHTQEIPLEQPLIAGIAHDRTQAKITVVGVPDRPGIASGIFRLLADAKVNVDMIVQNVSVSDEKTTDLSVTIPETQGDLAMSMLRAAEEKIGYASLEYNDQVGKLSLVGAGMKSNPGVSFTFFDALAEHDINIDMISTSEVRISVVTAADRLDEAVRAVHSAFGLDSQQDAAVYGGTGR